MERALPPPASSGGDGGSPYSSNSPGSSSASAASLGRSRVQLFPEQLLQDAPVLLVDVASVLKSGQANIRVAVELPGGLMVL